MNPLKQRLQSGGVITAAWASLGSPDVAEIMVRHGWDVLVIDGEHGIGDLECWVAMARAVQAAGGQIILRVPDGHDTTLKKVLDRGFDALIVPMVNSVAQAQAILDSCRYPGRGKRGYCAPVIRGSGWGTQAGYARGGASDDLLLILQCEHVDAVGALPQIAALEGVDMLFLGPHDLAGSVDHIERLDQPVVQDLIARVEAQARAADMPLATILGAGRDWGDLARLGYRLIVGKSDVALLSGAARDAQAARDTALAASTGGGAGGSGG